MEKALNNSGNVGNEKQILKKPGTKICTAKIMLWVSKQCNFQREFEEEYRKRQVNKRFHFV